MNKKTPLSGGVAIIAALLAGCGSTGHGRSAADTVSLASVSGVGNVLVNAHGFALYSPVQEKGGTILHGEQAFEYHRPLVVGDVLVGEGKVAEAYEKESGDSVMTFVITETQFRDEKTGELVLTSRTNLLHRGKK